MLSFDDQMFSEKHIYMRLKCRLNCPLNIYSCIHTFFCFFFLSLSYARLHFYFARHTYIHWNTIECVYEQEVLLRLRLRLFFLLIPYLRWPSFAKGQRRFFFYFKNWHYTIVSSQWTWPTPNWRKRKRERKKKRDNHIFGYYTGEHDERKKTSDHYIVWLYPKAFIILFKKFAHHKNG